MFLNRTTSKSYNMITICRWDYLTITNDRKEGFNVYCGTRTGTIVYVIGNFAALTFYSDYETQARGFVISFSVFPFGKLNHS